MAIDKHYAQSLPIEEYLHPLSIKAPKAAASSLEVLQHVIGRGSKLIPWRKSSSALA